MPHLVWAGRLASGRGAHHLHQVGGFAHNAQGRAPQRHAQGLPPREAAAHRLHRNVNQRLISVADKAAGSAGNGPGSFVEALGGQVVGYLHVAPAHLNAGPGGLGRPRLGWLLGVGKARSSWRGSGQPVRKHH